MTIECNDPRFSWDSALLNAILEHVDQGILMVDANGYVVVCNQRAIDLLGLPADLMRSNPFFEDVKRWQMEQGEFAAVGGPLLHAIKFEGINIEASVYERQRPNGTVLEVRTNRLPNGGVVRTFTDITVRKAAEEAAAKNEARYRALVEASSVVMWCASPDGRITEFWGKEATHKTSGEGNGFGWPDDIHPDDRHRVAANWRKRLRAPGPFSNEYRALSPDGQYRWHSSSCVPLLAADGLVREWVGTITDIDDRKLAEERLRESEERYRLAAHAASDAIWDWDLAEDRLQWGEAFQDIFGYEPAQVPTSSVAWLECVHPDDRARVGDKLHHFVSDKDERWQDEYRLRRGDGSYAFVSDRGSVIRDPSGTPVRMVGAMQDLSERHRAEDAIRMSEERLRLALQASKMAAWELDLQTQWVDRSDNSMALLGIGSGPASDFIDRVHPEDRPKVLTFWQAVRSEGTSATEVRYRAPGNKQTWVSLRAERKDADRLIGLTFDIADRKATEDAIWRTANHDPLTGLANRALFQSRLEEALRNAEISVAGVGLLLLDLDDFKDVNDTLGHAVGDLLLRETAHRLSRFVGKGDTVARLGGDEFAIILAEMAGAPDATTRARAIVEALRVPFQHEERALSTAASIGVAAFPEHHRDPIELMKDADIALYRAKEQGRSQAVMYTSAAREAMEHRVTIAREVREGLTARQFRPDYQPKVSLTTGEIVGFEALARWQHPTKGLLTPSHFGSVFGDREISIALGEHMVRQVAADIRSWLEQGLDFGRVAVNLSSADFSDPRLADRIIRILEEAHVPLAYFEIEVTETVFLPRRTATAAFTLNQLHKAGISIALDDFGTGFASLIHLKQFPVDHIKIDQSFVRDLLSDDGDAAIVAAIINLGHAMGMHTTAEGVENAQQAKRLREAGCDFAQGFLYAKPQPGSEVPGILQTWPVDRPGRA